MNGLVVNVMKSVECAAFPESLANPAIVFFSFFLGGTDQLADIYGMKGRCHDPPPPPKEKNITNLYELDIQGVS